MRESLPLIARQAIEIANLVGMGSVVEQELLDLWGDPGRVEQVAQMWTSASANTEDMVIAKLREEVSTRFAAGGWDGDAKRLYVAWNESLRQGALSRMQTGFAAVGDALNDVAKTIREMQFHLTWMCREFVVAAATAGYGARQGRGRHVKGKGHWAAMALLAALIAKFIYDLAKYHDEKLLDMRTHAIAIKKAYDSHSSKFVEIDENIGVPIIRATPDLPARQIGDWHSWGGSNDVPRLD